MNNSGLSDPPLPRLGPRREPASLAPAPPPRWGASRRGRKRGAPFAAQQAPASATRCRGRAQRVPRRLAGYPPAGWVRPGGLGAARRGLYYVVNLWDTTLGPIEHRTDGAPTEERIRGTPRPLVVLGPTEGRNDRTRHSLSLFDLVLMGA